MLRIINNKLSDVDALLSTWLRSKQCDIDSCVYTDRHCFNLKSESNDFDTLNY